MPSLVNPLTFQLNEGVVLNDDILLAGQPFVDIDQVTGLDSSPYRETRRDHEGTDGGFIDAEFETGRPITLKGTAYGNGGDLDNYLDSLKSNYSPVRTPIPFYFILANGVTRLTYVKPLGCAYNWDSSRRIGATPIEFKMYAEDPRIYANSLSSATLPIGGIITTGLSFNLTFNLGFGGGGSAAGQFINNLGNRSTPLLFTVNGPVTTPQIINDTLGITMTFNIDVGASETLVIDTGNHTVRLNGITNRRNVLLSPTWFSLDPGLTFIRFQAAAGSGTLTVQFRSAWR